MQSENVKEFELIRAEMSTVKDCITKYIGFVLGGSGVAVYGIAGMGKNSDNHSSMSTFEMVIVCFAISIIIHFVLLVLFYKFHSHNRFAGYCKLLNHERYELAQSKEDFSFFAWEVLVDKLRSWDTRPELLNNIQDINIKDMNISKLKNLLEKMHEARKENFVKSFVKRFTFLMSVISGKGEFRSWAFPPLVVAMFFFLSFGFFIAGNIFFIKLIRGNPATLIPLFGTIILVTLFFAQVGMWYHYIGKLHALMEGSTSIHSFFLKFMPVRALFLKKHGITPEYLATEIDDL